MDAVGWLPIDGSTITEIHKRYQMLPGCFPHRTLITQQQCEKRKEIRPQNDGIREVKPSKRQLQAKKITATAKKLKSAKKRKRRAEKCAAEQVESLGLAESVALADDYGTSREQFRKDSLT